MALEIWRLIETREIAGIKLQSKDSVSELSFRVEILRHPRKPQYRAQISRWDSYRMQPSFPRQGGRPKTKTADCEFFVRDDFMSRQKFLGKSAAEVIKKVKSALERTFLGMR